MRSAIHLYYIIIMQLHYRCILSSTWVSSAGFCSAAVGFLLGVGAMLLVSDSKKSREIISEWVGDHNITSIVYQANCGVWKADLGEICFSDHFKTLNNSIAWFEHCTTFQSAIEDLYVLHRCMNTWHVYTGLPLTEVLRYSSNAIEIHNRIMFLPRTATYVNDYLGSLFVKNKRVLYVVVFFAVISTRPHPQLHDLNKTLYCQMFCVLVVSVQLTLTLPLWLARL